MKQIVFNALQTSLNGGIGRYSYELSKNLYMQNPDNMKIVIRKEDEKLFYFTNKENLIVVEGINNSKDRNLYEQFKLPKYIHKNYPEAIVHYPDSMAPLFLKNEVIITVHDIVFKKMKNVFTIKSRIWKNVATFFSLRKAKGIVAITEFTKNEVLKYYNISSDKIRVVHNGFNDFSTTDINLMNIRKEIVEINKPYIFTVNTISPRKNIDGIIKAFSEIEDKVNENLVISGAKGWLYEDVFALVEKLGLKDRVLFTDKVNDDELMYLYKNSEVYIYLSFYEGFGLSPLEAMSFGVPCIVSNESSIPEVVGEAAIKVNPYDNKECSEGLLEILSNKEKQNELRVKGYDRIKQFSWEKCALETSEFYK